MSKLPTAITTIMESSVNRYLALDPTSGDSLGGLENRIVELKLKEFSFPVYFKIQNLKIQVMDSTEESADVSLLASIPQLIKMTAVSGNDSILGDDLEMSGNMDVGRQFRDVFRNLDIDWEEILSRFTGDIVAHKLGNGIRKFNQWISHTGESIQGDITEYLQEESQQLPSATEVKQFIRQVDEVRLSVDRLEAKFKLLINTLEKQ